MFKDILSWLWHWNSFKMKTFEISFCFFWFWMFVVLISRADNKMAWMLLYDLNWKSYVSGFNDPILIIQFLELFSNENIVLSSLKTKRSEQLSPDQRLNIWTKKFLYKMILFGQFSCKCPEATGICKYT